MTLRKVSSFARKNLYHPSCKYKHRRRTERKRAAIIPNFPEEEKLRTGALLPQRGKGKTMDIEES